MTEAIVKGFQIDRVSTLLNKVVIVDGQPGCGKSMFSAIIASFERVEKLTLAYEIEFVCALNYLNRLDSDVAQALVKLYTDILIYDQMMSRETNFRPSDVSSVFRYPKPFKYLKRLFMKGNELIPQRIISEKPILHLTTHDLLGRSAPVFNALKEKLFFIEILRHPLYMIKQQALNMDYLIGNARHFDIYYTYNGVSFPYFVYGYEEEFIAGNDMDRAIYVIAGMTKRNDKFRESLSIDGRDKQVTTIPFENFVIKPWDYLREIEEKLGTTMSVSTGKILKQQKVPRKKYADGLGLEIYKRYGWEPPKNGLDENEEFAIRRSFAAKQASPAAMKVLDRLCAEYEEKYQGKKFNY